MRTDILLFCRFIVVLKSSEGVKISIFDNNTFRFVVTAKIVQINIVAYEILNKISLLKLSVSPIITYLWSMRSATAFIQHFSVIFKIY